MFSFFFSLLKFFFFLFAQMFFFPLCSNVFFSPDDVRLINRINVDHANARDIQSDFVYSGQYRTLLRDIFKAIPQLERIKVRKLAPGEQWFFLLSFSRVAIVVPYLHLSSAS
jgi:hypothetical protein